jgi:PPOX class probable FMN-dependent enzyme
MITDDPHRIASADELRATIGELNPMISLKIETGLNEVARAFVARSPFLLLATSDAEGRQEVSPKGDRPGFVAIEDERTLLIPDRKGNRLVMGLQNILRNPHVGTLFLIPGTPETLRVNGTAELTRDPAVCQRLAARGEPALLAIRVRVEECFFHCAKAFLRAELWKPATWPERQRISFGEMLVPKIGGDAKLAAAIDEAVEQDARTNL